METFKIVNTVIVPLSESITDDEIEILSIKISPNEEYLAVLGGKNLIKEIEEVYSLHIFKMNSDGTDYDLMKEIHFSDEFRSFSVTFEFCKKKQDEAVIFTDLSRILRFNFNSQNLETIYSFSNQLNR